MEVVCPNTALLFIEGFFGKKQYAAKADRAFATKFSMLLSRLSLQSVIYGLYNGSLI
jgi:hypothetical protein